jgi:hypothetical protein
MQKSNSLVSWGLNTAESSVQLALETTLPAVIVLERPIALIDSLLCKSLDVVEERVPVVTLPPYQVSVKSKLVCVYQLQIFNCTLLVTGVLFFFM